MDQKSQKNLSPELKAVYDRVMNTKISTRPAPPIQTNPPPKPADPAPAQRVPDPNKPTLRTEVIHDSQPAPAAAPASPPIPPTAETVQSAPAAVTQETPPANAPDLSPIEASQDQSGGFLSSLPPRPLNTMSDQPFVFTGGKTGAPEHPKEEAKEKEDEKTHEPQKSGNKLSSKIIVGLLVVFLFVYSMFWAKIFNIF